METADLPRPMQGISHRAEQGGSRGPTQTGMGDSGLDSWVLPQPSRCLSGECVR